MSSPFVSRLLTEIEQAHDTAARACLIADLAIYWARVGDFEEADLARERLRREFGDGKDLGVSVRLMCLEGILLYYKDLDPKARDRIARATLLSKAFRHQSLTALSSSWLAHIDFNLSLFSEMVADIELCLKSITENDIMADCRISLVLGDAFLFVGERQSAKHWYSRARRHATALGDHAAIGALTYNSSALRVGSARFSAAAGEDHQAEVGAARAELQSAINYQSIARIRSLEHLLETATIGINLLEGDYTQATPRIRKLLADPKVPRESAQRKLLEADLLLTESWAEPSLLSNERAEDLIEASSKMGADDQAIAFHSLEQAARRAGKTELLKRCASSRLSAVTAHRQTMFGLRAMLAPYAT